jgi:3-hydroxyacyl-[acyl-carrier-protein] dehydratase
MSAELFQLTSGGPGFEVEIPAASALFAGHFPGRPILPGIAHLALARRALGEILGREIELAAVRSLKLRRPLIPGDPAELRISAPGEDGAARFEVHCGGTVASQGVVEVWSGPISPISPIGPPDPEATGFPTPEALLPHAPPALLLRAVSEAGDGHIAAVAEVSPHHPLVAQGRFPAFLALEAAAQAAAALEALGRREPPGPRIGYLVGIRDARFAVPALPAGCPFRVAARLTGGAFPLSIYSVSAEAATGTLSTFLLAAS